MGYYFVEFCAIYGYGDVLALLGRSWQFGMILWSVVMLLKSSWCFFFKVLSHLRYLIHRQVNIKHYQRAERLLEWSGQSARVPQVLLPKVEQSKANLVTCETSKPNILPPGSVHHPTLLTRRRLRWKPHWECHQTQCCSVFWLSYSQCHKSPTW